MSKRQKSERQQLQNVLERHGANPDNWPASKRAGFLALVVRDRAAAQLFEEAGALECLLDLAAAETQVESEQDLQDRILHDFTARNKQAGPIAGVDVVDLPATGRGIGFAGAAVANWMTAGALAACFALGLFLGGYALPGWQLDPAASLASLSDRLADGQGGQVAEIGDLLAGSETGEELL